MNITKQTLKRARKLQAIDLSDQFAIVNGAAFLILKEIHGWDRDKILDVTSMASSIWEEIYNSNESITILEKCEAETGIEITLDGKKSYHELPYLDHSKWERIPTLAEEYYILTMERVWLPAMFTACLCISLHRLYQWDFDMLSKFCQDLNEVRKEKVDARYYRKLLMQDYKVEVQV